MPTYDYKCEGCGTDGEYNVPISDRDLPLFCPECLEPQMKRIISFRGLTWAPTAGGMR